MIWAILNPDGVTYGVLVSSAPAAGWVQLAAMPAGRGPFRLVADPNGGLPAAVPVTP